MRLFFEIVCISQGPMKDRNRSHTAIISGKVQYKALLPITGDWSNRGCLVRSKENYNVHGTSRYKKQSYLYGGL